MVIKEYAPQSLSSKGLLHLRRRNRPQLRGLNAQRGGNLRRFEMLLTIALILFVLWALGVFAFKVTAGVIHLVLIAALVIGLVQLFRGRRV
ncbi:lmo0937 family membrane protein [Novosphingobium sp.]|uniref:lmo0937 family membrane protein n=1 Tax=Novosphingobium sp. TaxID=1874826 RepID=UPI003BA8D6B2